MIKMAQFHVSESGSLLMITLVHFEVDVRTSPPYLCSIITIILNLNILYHFASCLFSRNETPPPNSIWVNIRKVKLDWQGKK